MQEISKEAMAVNAQAFICELRAFPKIEIKKVEKADLKNLTSDERADLATEIYQKGESGRAPAMNIWLREECANSKLYLAIDAFRRGDDVFGANLLEISGNMGNKTALLRFAYCLTMGIGVEPEIERAYKIYESLAREKVPCAVYFVGALQLLPDQNFIKCDTEKAQQKLMWSVNHGCKFAQFEQGVVEIRSAKNDAERERGLDLIKKAAEQNEVRAMLWYAIELVKGKIVQRDTNLAENYLKKCVLLGFEPAVNAVKHSQSEN